MSIGHETERYFISYIISWLKPCRARCNRNPGTMVSKLWKRDAGSRRHFIPLLNRAPMTRGVYLEYTTESTLALEVDLNSRTLSGVVVVVAHVSFVRVHDLLWFSLALHTTTIRRTLSHHSLLDLLEGNLVQLVHD